MIKKIICAAIIFAIICSACSCGAKKARTEYLFGYFDTVTAVTYFTNEPFGFDEIYTSVKETLEKYHNLFDAYENHDGINNLKTVNDRAGEWVEVEQDIIELIDLGKRYYNLTAGETNVAMGAVTSLWKEAGKYGNLPDELALNEAWKHTDIENVLVDRENNSLKLSDSAMKLDVGAIAKGYVLNKIRQNLDDAGYTGWLINFGGSVVASGKKPNGEPFVAGIENPRESSNESIIEKVTINDGVFLVTSGAYLRYYTINGKKYNHIIDKDTKLPAEHFLSVSVKCYDACLGDALSTALFCMSLEDGKKLLSEMKDISAMWVTDNEIYSYNWSK